jgi:hypothetical protein
MDFTKEVAYCKTELLHGDTTERGNSTIKLMFPIRLRGEVRDYHALNTPRFGVPVQGREPHNVVVSEG